MSRKFGGLALFTLVLSAGFTLRIAFPQALTGTLTGIVLDNSKSAVPGAEVVMKNAASGDVRRSTTNSEGYFTIAAVPTGTYTVTVEAKGFAKWEQTGVVFNPGDKRHLSDIVLQVGSTTEQVTVSAVGPLLVPVDSSEKSAVITEKQLQNIAVVGRSAAELIKILPGMSPTGSGVENRPGFSGEAIGINGNGDGGHQSALGYYSGNGTQSQAMDIVGDGAHISDPGCNCATPINPNVDMLSEFKVLQSNYAAEHAKGPIVLNAASKSGGRDFHGTGYYYLRDYRLNSNEWDLNRSGGERPKNKYRFPGFNIGGPVLIPGTNFNKNRDKLFFFVGYEHYGQTIDTGVLRAIVPTEAMRNGDFSNIPTGFSGSAGVRNRPTGPGINNGLIPSSMFDPGGKILMNLLPLPNADPATNSGVNFVKALTLDQPMHQFLSRVDYSVSDYTKIFVRYNLQRETQNFPVGLWWRNGDQVPYPSPVTAPNRSDSISASITHVFSPSLTNETIFGLTYIDFPNTITDRQKVSRSALGYPYKGIFKNGEELIPGIQVNGGASMFMPGGFDPILFARKWEVSAADNLSKTWGTHTMKFGFYWEIVTNNQPGNDWSNGYLTFDISGATSTGNAYADLLLGRVSSYSESTKNVLHNIGFRTYEFYAQDSWKIIPRLTLEYGARFAHLGAWYDRQGFGSAIFDRSQYSNNPADLAKLTGLRWHKIDPSIPLSGRNIKPLYVTPRLGIAYDLFGTGKTVFRGGFGMFRYHDAQQTIGLDIPAGFKSTSTPQATTMAAIENFVPGAQKLTTSVIDPKDDQQPLIYNWSVTIDQRLPANSVWEISYVGNKSKYLLPPGYPNPNLIPFGAMLADPNGSTDQYRPLQNYQQINVSSHVGYQNYHSLQTTWSRQSGRLSYQFAYTFSKALGLFGPGDPFNLRSYYGVAPYDRTHIFNVAYSYQLPDFARSWMASNSRALHAAIDGWQLSGVSQFASSINLQSANQDYNSQGNFNLQGFTTGGVALKQTAITGSPDIPMMPVLTCDPRANLQPNQYINGSCFAPPSPGQNGGFKMPYIKGPGFMNHDLSVFKNWDFTETKKLQFRFSAYNFLNHPVRSFVNGDQNLNLVFDEVGKLANPRFGFADRKVGRRIVQLAIKFYF